MGFKGLFSPLGLWILILIWKFQWLLSVSDYLIFLLSFGMDIFSLLLEENLIASLTMGSKRKGFYLAKIYVDLDMNKGLLEAFTKCRTIGDGCSVKVPLSWKVIGLKPRGYQKIEPCEWLVWPTPGAIPRWLWQLRCPCVAII